MNERVIREVPVSVLRHAPDNPRSIPSTGNVGRLARSLEIKGLVVPLVAYQDDGLFYVCDGHSRLEAMRLLGWQHQGVQVLVIAKEDAFDYILLAHEPLRHRSYDKARQLAILAGAGKTPDQIGVETGRPADLVSAYLAGLDYLKQLELPVKAYGLCHTAARCRIPAETLAACIRSGHVTSCAHIKLLPMVMRYYPKPWDMAVSLSELARRVIMRVERDRGGSDRETKSRPQSPDHADAQRADQVASFRRRLAEVCADGQVHNLRELEERLDVRGRSSVSCALSHLVQRGTLRRVGVGQYQATIG